MPARCLEELERADLIIHAGDVVSADALAALARRGPIEAVRGNKDDAELQSALPASRIVELDGARIGLIHDAGRRAGREGRLARMFPECDAIVYGHTHIPQADRRGDRWILNPGSPTERRRGPHRSMLVVEVDSGAVLPRLIQLP